MFAFSMVEHHKNGREQDLVFKSSDYLIMALRCGNARPAEKERAMAG